MSNYLNAQKGITVAGIHTGIGKTLCSAIMAETLGYDYWKPVQAGDLANSDTIWVQNHVSNPACNFHTEAYRLSLAASPHWAAMEDNIEITLDNLSLPRSTNNILVETAGGIMSPLAINLLNIHLIQHLQLPVVLVSHDYLGSINHTLLSVQALQQAEIPILGIVFSGEEVSTTRKFILEYTNLPLLFSIPLLEVLTKEVVKDFAESIASTLKASILA